MRNHLGLTEKQSAFVARGGMRRTKTQTRKARVYHRAARAPHAVREIQPVIKSGEFKGLSEATAAQILALREYFLQSAK